jgi:hypothetical protein
VTSSQRQLLEQIAPTRKAVVHVQTLGHVSRERDALPAGHRLSDDRELDGAEILSLVDQNVLVRERLLAAGAQERPAQALIKAQQQRIVLRVQLRLVAPIGLFLVLGPVPRMAALVLRVRVAPGRLLAFTFAVTLTFGAAYRLFGALVLGPPRRRGLLSLLDFLENLGALHGAPLVCLVELAPAE